ncbi:unnamed protein product [Owenia fusiformis]|uniref:Uncharacterized protein n=1 Tax=Owenia fusiformis TaxID=6347 RepID=A0A8J1XVQ3_OWEFU|nr:unnamed protein product [Owenia fusiformis]
MDCSKMTKMQYVCLIATALVAIVTCEKQHPMVRRCILGCGMCVGFWGKQNYDGENCAIGCAKSLGKTIDMDCENIDYHVGKRSVLDHDTMEKRRFDVNTCQKSCENCVALYTNAHYDEFRCKVACSMTNGESTDVNCDKADVFLTKRSNPEITS